MNHESLNLYPALLLFLAAGNSALNPPDRFYRPDAAERDFAPRRRRRSRDYFEKERQPRGRKSNAGNSYARGSKKGRAGVALMRGRLAGESRRIYRFILKTAS